MSSNRKIVRVQYSHQDVFKLPKGLDLEDETQVKSWGVKYNTLYITKVDGTELEINSEGWINHFDYKYPDVAEIIDADDEDIYYSDNEDECKYCGWRCEYPESHILYCGGDRCEYIRNKSIN